MKNEADKRRTARKSGVFGLTTSLRRLRRPRSSRRGAPHLSTLTQPARGRIDVFAQIRDLLRALGPATRLIAGFSVVVNLLLLVAPLYMLQVYDRVLTSGSGDTLIWLTVMAVGLLFVYGAAEAGRRRVAALAAEQLDDDLSSLIHARFASSGGSSAALLADISLQSRLRPLLTQQLVFPFFDLPFTPLFLGVLFVVHPALGAAGVFGAALIIGVAAAAEMSTRSVGADAAAAAAKSADYAQGLAQNRSAILSMGLAGATLRQWRAHKHEAHAASIDASERDGAYAAASRSLRQALQIIVLAVGAALAIVQAISPGAIVAASIVLARALGPIDQIVGGWRSIVQAATAWGQLRAHLKSVAPHSSSLALPAPPATLKIERLVVTPPGASAPIIRSFGFEASGGALVAIVGDNGAGKSTLLQTIAGVWAPSGGEATLGGRSVHQWAGDDRGRHVGYAPQEHELLPGSIAENIARFDMTSIEEIYTAANAVGAHEAILRLPKGYETPIGPDGTRLSAGQRQLVALARAFFRTPILLLLDEPTANLDAASSARVIAAIAAAGARGSIVLAATHDRALIAAMKSVLILQNGSVLSADAAAYLQPRRPAEPIRFAPGAGAQSEAVTRS